MSRRSIRKIIAKARRNSFRGLKQQIRGTMWVDDITVDTHLAVFSDEYMRLFWSHLITECTFLRTPKQIDRLAELLQPEKFTLRRNVLLTNPAGRFANTFRHIHSLLRRSTGKKFL